MKKEKNYYNNEIKRLNDEIKKLNSEIIRVNKIITEKEKTIIEITKTLKSNPEQEKLIFNLQEQIKLKEKQIKDLTRELNMLHNQNEKLKKEYSFIGEDTKKLQEENRKLNRDISKYIQLNNEKEKKLKELQYKNNDELISENKFLKNEVTTLKSEIIILKKKLSENNKINTNVNFKSILFCYLMKLLVKKWLLRKNIKTLFELLSKKEKNIINQKKVEKIEIKSTPFTPPPKTVIKIVKRNSVRKFGSPEIQSRASYKRRNGK